MQCTNFIEEKQIHKNDIIRRFGQPLSDYMQKILPHKNLCNHKTTIIQINMGCSDRAKLQAAINMYQPDICIGATRDVIDWFRE